MKSWAVRRTIPPRKCDRSMGLVMDCLMFAMSVSIESYMDDVKHDVFVVFVDR
jgi:hypothetical protein